MDFLKIIEQVASKIAPGFVPSFSEVHVLKALETINSNGTVGRGRLSKKIGLGQGTTRTLTRHMGREGLIKVTKAGMNLSRLGVEVLSEIISRISKHQEIPESSITVGPFNSAVLVTNVADLVRYGVEQRDSAIKIGASGATTLIFKKGRLIIPGEDENIIKNIKSIKKLLSLLKPKEKDVIIIGSAESRDMAEYGAKAAALELLKSEK